MPFDLPVERSQMWAASITSMGNINQHHADQRWIHLWSSSFKSLPTNPFQPQLFGMEDSHSRDAHCNPGSGMKSCSQLVVATHLCAGANPREAAQRCGVEVVLGQWFEEIIQMYTLILQTQDRTCMIWWFLTKIDPVQETLERMLLCIHAYIQNQTLNRQYFLSINYQLFTLKIIQSLKNMHKYNK